MSLTFCTKGVRAVGRYAPRDASNAVASFKGCQDGICEAWGTSDDYKHLQLGAVSIDNTRGPFVIVTIEPASQPLARRSIETDHELGAAVVRDSATGVDD
jgi:hypothetical protein